MATERRLLKSEESAVPLVIGGHSGSARSEAQGFEGSRQTLCPRSPEAGGAGDTKGCQVHSNDCFH